MYKTALTGKCVRIFGGEIHSYYITMCHSYYITMCHTVTSQCVIAITSQCVIAITSQCVIAIVVFQVWRFPQVIHSSDWRGHSSEIGAYLQKGGKHTSIIGAGRGEEKGVVKLNLI